MQASSLFDRRVVGWAVAAGRIAIGIVAYLLPDYFGRVWFGEVADEPGAQVATRAFAVRDLAVGVGTAAAMADDRDTSPWLGAGVLSDAGDVVATLLARRSLPTWKVVGAVTLAGGAALAGAWLRYGEKTPVAVPEPD